MLFHNLHIFNDLFIFRVILVVKSRLQIISIYIKKVVFTRQRMTTWSVPEIHIVTDQLRV